ncbi:hypothetical protein D3C72_1817730 [compost metagenome]
MHQHVGVIFPGGGLFQNRHQLFPIGFEKSVQIFPFMHGGNERPNLTVSGLIVCQQLQLVAAVIGQKRTAGQAAGAYGVQLVKGKNARNEILPQHRIVQASVLFHRQPRIPRHHGGGKYATFFLRASIPRFIINSHPLHTATWRFGADDKSIQIRD